MSGRSILPVLMTALLALLWGGNALAMYHPGVGRFVQRDPYGTQVDMQPRLTSNNHARPLNAFNQRDIISVDSRSSFEIRHLLQYTDGANLYQYLKSNPSRYSDPSGLVCGSGPIGDLLVPDSFWRADFTDACQNHDDCYGRCGSDKGKCDQGLYDDMIDACENAYPWAGRNLWDWNLPERCRARARLYYNMVDRYGQGPFDSAQEDCECDD